MSTHKHFDKICCVVLALTLIITVLFVNSESLFGVQKASTVMAYESTLFDTSRVHTIDIIMDDWDEFTASATSEEYYVCSVVIDNEAFKNVAIRGKGNTSLSSVTNGRYSYKIEFDHYDSTNTYHGLDKLCLNNIIQDNTYMKDYLTYTLMNEMGVAAPLCSYAYITVNGEDWGLYLAVEGVEESFLQRNYGRDYGELYKPDSLSMGGGRGNGNEFDADSFLQDFDFSFDFDFDSAFSENESTTDESVTQAPEESETDENEEASKEESTDISEEETSEDITLPDFGGEIPDFGGEIPDFGGEIPDFGGEIPDFGSEMPDLGDMLPGLEDIFSGLSGLSSDSNTPAATEISKTSSNGSQFYAVQTGMFNGMTPPDFSGELPEGFTVPDFSGELPEGMTPPTDGNGSFELPENFSDIFEESMGGFGGMGSSDVKLQYIDDNEDSYSNIFSNAKTDITDADKKRLIEALKNLSSNEAIESTVDTEAVIRYFVVHNFVVNSDSYTGSMIHNYYLYEKDGQLQMIPWDYNLAFGSFMSTGSATGSVNDPIDTPLSVSVSGDRPMFDWIFGNEEYTALYHSIFNEFIEKYFDSGYFTELIDGTASMISPYVEKDPTKFCSYEEFETGFTVLKEFCLLRAESIRGQLDGTIGSSSATQEADTLIDASHINTGDMGSMGMGGGMNMPGGDMQRPQSGNNSEGDSAENGSGDDSASDMPDNGSQNGSPSVNSPDSFMQNGAFPGFSGGKMPQTGSSDMGQMSAPDSGGMPGGNMQPQGADSSSTGLILISIAVLALGLIIAFAYKRRK